MNNTYTWDENSVTPTLDMIIEEAAAEDYDVHVNRTKGGELFLHYTANNHRGIYPVVLRESREPGQVMCTEYCKGKKREVLRSFGYVMFSLSKSCPKIIDND